MIRLFSILALAALLPCSSLAGILVDATGKPTEGRFSTDASTGLLFQPSGGTASPVQANNFQALEIDSKDAVWPEEYRQNAKGESGMLGFYYEGRDLDGARRQRVDSDIDFSWDDKGPFPGWRVDHFSVRWTGRLRVPKTGDYTFITTSDDGVRLAINGKRRINNWSEHSVTENKTTLRLEKGKVHDIRIEYYESTGEAMMRVEFIGPDKKRHPLSRLIKSGEASAIDLPLLSDAGLKPGIILRDGSVLLTKIKQANDTAFVLGQPFEGLTISTFNIARVVFREIPAKTAAAAQSKRQGALLVGGDFVDGEFKSFERGILKISSILFGHQTLETKYETHAVLLHEPMAENPAWRVRDYKGNVLLAQSIRFTEESVILTSPILKDFHMPLSQVYRIDAGTGSELFPKSLGFGPSSVHARKDAKASGDDRRRADSLKRLAAREKDKLLRNESNIQKDVRAEKEKLIDARERVASHEKKVGKAREDHRKAATEYHAYLEKYDEAVKIYEEINAEYQTGTRAYDKRRGDESRASKSIRDAAKDISRLQSDVKRKSRGKDDKRLKKLQADLAGKQQEYAKAKETLAQAQRSTREAADQKNKLYRRADTARRNVSKAKSVRDSKKRMLDSRQRTLNYEGGHLKSAQSKVAAALAKIDERKHNVLR